MANETTPQALPNQQSQTIPAGNHTAPAPSLDKAMIELQRREKALRDEQAKIKDAVSLSSLKERAAKDRNGLLKELGLDDLIQADPNDPVAELKKQLEDMQNRQKSREEQEAQERMFQSFQSQFKEKSNDYELTSLLGREKDLFDYIHSNKTESGDLPDWTEAAKQLEDMILADLSKFKGSKKVMELFASQKPETPRHPLDNRATMTSTDSQATAPNSNATPAPNRYQQLDQLKQHLKFV